MIDYNVKSEVLNDGSFDNYMQYRRLYYSLGCTCPFGSSETSEYLQQFNEFCKSSKFNECDKLYHSRKQRTKRLRGSLTKWFNVGFLYFLTLTFNDEAFERTSALTRKRAVSKFLRSFNSVFVANIDYGKKKEREHFHAVLCVENPLVYSSHIVSRNRFCIRSDSLSFWERSYGYYSCIRISDDDSSDLSRLSRYINKLTFHAIKDTAKGSRLIYSRNIPEWYKLKRKEFVSRL